MADTLEVFGVEYTNVTGIKATDNNGNTITYTKGGGTPTLQTKSKTYTPTTSRQTESVTADNGYDGLGEVDITVNAVPTGVFDDMVIATENDTSISVSSSGLITARVEGSISTHPVRTAGYFDTSDTTNVVIEGYKTYQLSTQAGATITPSTTQQTAVTSGKYTTGNVIVSAVPSGTAGTPTATKGTVSNHSVSVTPSVTNTTGYITGGTKSGTAVTVSASELVSGSETKTENGTYDVTNLAQVVVALDFITVYSGSGDPSPSIGKNGDIYLKVVG